MPPYLEILLGKSFEIIPGEFYNQYRLEVAERLGDTYLFYELSLLEEKPWRTLRESTYPLFVRYIKAKLIDPATANGVVVAIFHADKCHLCTNIRQFFFENGMEQPTIGPPDCYACSLPGN